MPLQYNNNLDDEPTPDGCSTFVGGMYSNAKARLLKPEQAAGLVDCDVSITGGLQLRRGTVQIGADVASSAAITGVGYYKAGSANYELAATSSGVYKLNGGSWTQLGAQTFGSGQVNLIQGGLGGSVTGAVGDDKLHVCGDGTDIYQWDGAAWTNLSSPETAASAPRNVSLLCWHTGRLVAAGANIKTRTADTSVVPDGMYFSDELSPAVWGTTTYDTQIRVGGGDGSEITAMVPWTGVNIAVFKRNSSWVVVADPTLPPASFTIQAVHSSVGCVAPRTAVQVGADIMFLSQDGVRSLEQTIASEQQHQLGVPLSFPIQDFIRRINWTSAGSACATFWNNKYILFAPLDGSTTNNYAFVYDTIISAWSGYWTNLPVSCCTIRKSSVRQSLMMGLHTDDKVIEYLDYVNESDATDATYQDWNGFNVQPIVVTRAFTFGDPKAPKHGLDYEMEWSDSKGTITITLQYDGLAVTEPDPLPDVITMTRGGFAIPFSLPLIIGGAGIQRQMFDLARRGRFREFQLVIAMTGAGRKELRQVTVNAFVEPAVNLLGDGVGEIISS